jgi:hypothetical protein
MQRMQCFIFMGCWVKKGSGQPTTRVGLEVYRSGLKWIEVEVGTGLFRSGTDWEHF